MMFRQLKLELSAPLLGIGFLAGSLHIPVEGHIDDPSVAASYVDAYNSRDLVAMTALMHEDVEWLSIEGSEVVVFASGKPDLTGQMQDYFDSPMATTAEIDGELRDGRFVAAREIARWTDGNGNVRSQSALAIYEVENGLIRRVWYYPSTR